MSAAASARAAAAVSPSVLLAGSIVTAMLAAGIVMDLILIAKARQQPVDWSARYRRLCVRPWTLHDALHLVLVLATVLAALILAMQILDHGGIVLSDSIERAFMIVQTLLVQGVTLLTVAQLRHRHQHSYSDCFATPELSLGAAIRKGVVLYLATMPLVVASAIGTNLLLQTFDIPIDTQQVLQGFADPSASVWFRACLVILAIALAPLVEEILFRGIALPVIAKIASPKIAVVAVSLIFAVVHGHLPAIIPLFVVATGFSWAYIATGSILVPMTMHALFNSINLILFYLSYDVMAS